MAWNSDFRVKKFCPELTYTCCDSAGLEHLFSFLKKSFDYVRYRDQEFRSLFLTISKIDDQNFKKFLNNLDEADIKCYNSRELPNQEQRDASRLMKEFVYLKSVTESFINIIEKISKEKEQFMASFICSVCSPYFYKAFNKAEDGNDYLNLNQNMCNDVIRRKIQTIDVMLIFTNIQKIIDITICAKNNSMRDFTGASGDVVWGEFDYIQTNVSVLLKYHEMLSMCTKHINSFVENTNFCPTLCQQNLNIMNSSFADLFTILTIENEIHNFFFENVDPEKYKIRLHEKKKEYMKRRDTLAYEGNIVNITTTGKHTLVNLKEVNHTSIAFDKINLNIERISGLNLNDFKGNVNLLSSVYSLIQHFIWLLFVGLFFLN